MKRVTWNNPGAVSISGNGDGTYTFSGEGEVVVHPLDIAVEVNDRLAESKCWYILIDAKTLVEFKKYKDGSDQSAIGLVMSELGGTVIEESE